MPYKWCIRHRGSAGRDRGRDIPQFTHTHIDQGEVVMTTLINTASWIGLPSFAGWLKKINAKLQHRRMVKRTIKELSACTDRELADMGLTRGDIYAVANGDPSYQRATVNKNLGGWV